MSISIDVKSEKEKGAGSCRRSLPFDQLGESNKLEPQKMALPESLPLKKSMPIDSISIHIGKISLQSLRLKKEVLAIPTVL